MSVPLFEHTFEFNERSYRDVWTSRPRRWFRFSIITFVGVAMLFSAYTLVSGVLILLLLVLTLIIPRIFSWTLAHKFHVHRYLHGPVTYGVSHERLWLRGETVDVSASWSLLYTWHITGGWLVLSPWGIPLLFFPVADMKEAGVMEPIMELARQYGTEVKWVSRRTKRSTVPSKARGRA